MSALRGSSASNVTVTHLVGWQGLAYVGKETHIILRNITDAHKTRGSDLVETGEGVKSPSALT